MATEIESFMSTDLKEIDNFYNEFDKGKIIATQTDMVCPHTVNGQYTILHKITVYYDDGMIGLMKPKTKQTTIKIP